MFPELYHAHHNLHLDDLPFWLELATQTGDPILELGCGTGRVLHPLAQAGQRCVGLDYDLQMLQYFWVNLDPQLSPKPMLICADISQFSLAKQFALIMSPCNTFSTLTSKARKACLTCVRRHLQPGGLFAVCVPNPELLEQLPARSEPELEDEFINLRTGNPVQVSSTWRKTRDVFNVTWIYDHLLPDGTVQRLIKETRHQKISVLTYLKDIQAAGLKMQRLYGDFDWSAYTPESPNLIILAHV